MADPHNARYRLMEVLGRGAMGVVWRAHDSVLDREVAIKELHAGEGVDPAEAMDRFLVEARAAARLSHPNIVAVHDVFSDGEQVLIAMELVAGPTLDVVVRATGAQPADVVRAIMAQVAQALAAAHQAGVIHRDLKPENIFWTPQGRTVVADFGLARIGAGRGTVDGAIMGTPGYMSPEQVRGLVMGPTTDVFGWGAVAYELATGRAPFGEPSATDPSAMAYRIVHQDPPPLILDSDPALAALITLALAKNPADRPRDGTQLLTHLGPFRPGSRNDGSVRSATGLAEGSQPVTSPSAPRRRTGAVLGLIGIVGLVATAVLVAGLSIAGASRRGAPAGGAPRPQTSLPAPTEPSSTLAPTTTEPPPPPVPTGTSDIPPGRYVTSGFRPALGFVVEAGWHSVAAEERDMWLLVRRNRPTTNLVTFVVTDRVFGPTSASLTLEQARLAVRTRNCSGPLLGRRA